MSDEKMAGFDRREGVFGGRHAMLTLPRKDKWTWAPEERHKRSLVTDAATGEVLSQGFPKFHNYGEVETEDDDTRAAFAEGRVVLREKLDGSLIIRDVVDGRVCWRTRGSLTLGAFEERVMALVEAGPAHLRDPSRGVGCSMLFEYTSPDNRIVVQYDRPALTPLAVVWRDLRHVGGGYWTGLGLVDGPRSVTPREGFDAVLVRVSAGDLFDEGVVVACYGARGVKLVKMKAAEYVRLHSLMTECTRPKVAALLERAGARTMTEARGALMAAGLDWESMTLAAAWAAEYVERHEVVTQARAGIAGVLAKLVGIDRKGQAQAMREVCSGSRAQFFSMAMAMCSGRDVGDFMGAYRCDMPVNAYRAMMGGDA